MRVFVGFRFEQVQFGLEAFHVRAELGNLALFLLDGRLEGRHFVTLLLVTNHFVVVSAATRLHCKNIRLRIIRRCFAASFPHLNGAGSVYVCVRKSTE